MQAYADAHAESDTRGLAVLCDASGIITQVLWDDLGLAATLCCGQPLTASVERGSRAKTHSFLLELREKGVIFAWEINVQVAGRIISLQFGGVAEGDLLLVMAAATGSDVMRLYEELASINNEQATALRAAASTYVKSRHAHHSTDSQIYNELSYLNNELANAHRELAKQNAELERLNMLKNQFLGMAAHDLRSPLSVLLSYSEFLLDDLSGTLGSEHTEFLQIIHRSSQFMLGLVNDLLDVSLIESGRLDLHLQPIDLSELVQHSVKLNGVLAERKQVHISLAEDDEIPIMLVDAGKIGQVMDNLLSNAVKYSPPGAVVTVHLKRQDREIVITIHNPGAVVPPEELERLFQWLGKTSVRSTAGEKSSGLGLAIARRIMEGHQGHIWVDRTVVDGMTFCVALPIVI
jgi:signal transduction histidine kinase